MDDELAEAHAALGAEKADFEYDWPGAEREFKRALELNPNYAEAHFRHALTYLMPLGKPEQANAEMKRALELDPFSPIYNTVFGLTYSYARRYDQAQEQFRKAIKLNPDFLSLTTTWPGCTRKSGSMRSHRRTHKSTAPFRR